MTDGHLLIAWTIRLSMGCYLAVLISQLAGGVGKNGKKREGASPKAEQSENIEFQTSPDAMRFVWAIGCGLFLLHMGCAFHYQHQWSHALFFADVAQQTRQMLGWEFGYGVYFNYLFAAIWSADTAWRLAAPHSYLQRPRWVTAAIHLYLLFIIFNGVVIFKTGLWRYGGLAAIAALLPLFVRSLAVKKESPIVR